MSINDSLYPNYSGNPQRLDTGYTEGDDTVAGATDYNKHDDEILKHQDLIKNINAITGAALSLPSNHAALNNLDYASANHTGFQASLSTGSGIAIVGTTINGTNDQNLFNTIDVEGTDITANSLTTTLNFRTGAGILLEADNNSKTITISASDPQGVHSSLLNLDYASANHTGFQASLSTGSGIAIVGTTINGTNDQNLFNTIDVEGTDITANSLTTTLNFRTGAGIHFTTNNTTKTITIETGFSAGIDIGSDINWYDGNVIYIPVGANISNYVLNASSGDTLILGSGNYTITSAINVDKALNIIGQGFDKTFILCSTNSVNVFYATSDYVTFRDLSIALSGSGQRAIYFDASSSGGVFSYEMLFNIHAYWSGGGAITAETGCIEYNDATGGIYNCTFELEGVPDTSTGNIYGLKINSTNASTVNPAWLRCHHNFITLEGDTTGNAYAIWQTTSGSPSNGAKLEIEDNIIYTANTDASGNAYGIVCNGSVNEVELRYSYVNTGGINYTDIVQSNSASFTVSDTTLGTNTTSGTFTFKGVVLTNGLYANGSIYGSYITSTISSGSAPYNCTSTTLNTNLNSDLLDGQHGSYYAIANDYLKLDQTTPQTITASPIFNWVVSGRVPYYSSTKTIIDSANLNFDGTTLTGGGFTTTGTVTIGNGTTGTLDLTGLTANVSMFSDAVIAGGMDGYSSYIYRNSNYLCTYIDQYGGVVFRASDAGGSDVVFQTTTFRVDGSFRVGESYLTTNPTSVQYGYITAVAAEKYIQWQVNDTTDYFELTRQDANILGLDIQMPLITDNATIEGALDLTGVTSDIDMWGDLLVGDDAAGKGLYGRRHANEGDNYFSLNIDAARDFYFNTDCTNTVFNVSYNLITRPTSVTLLGDNGTDTQIGSTYMWVGTNPTFKHYGKITVPNAIKYVQSQLAADGYYKLTREDTNVLGVDVQIPLITDDICSSSYITGSKFISTVAIGAQPYSCISTTLNNNLNADLWDGYQFSDYLDQAVKTTSSPTFVDTYITNMKLGSATYSSLNDAFKLFTSAGRISGGTITDDGTLDGKVTIAAGTGVIRIADDDVSQVKFFDWAASANVDIPINTTRFIGVEYNTGNPQISVRTTQNWDYDTDFPLGIVVNEADSLYIINDSWWTSDHVTNIIERFQAEGRLVRDDLVGGLILGNTGTRQPSLSGGTIWARLNEFAISPISGGTAFDTYYYDGDLSGGVWVKGTATQWDNLNYNTVATGLTPLGVNKYANLWFFVGAATGKLIMVYGQASYDTAAQAAAGAVPATLPSRLQYMALFVGRIVFRQNVNTPVSVDSAFSQSFTIGTVQDHGNLAGLSDDDHTQYLLADGTRKLTNNWYAGEYNLTITGASAATSYSIGGNTLTTLEFSYLDGQNQSVKTISNVTFSAITGSSLQITGAADFDSTVLLAQDPTLNLQAATKQYVDTRTGASSSHTHLHNLLTNLDYASANHTGFEPTVTKGNMTATSPILVDATRQVIGGAVIISHATTAGNIHIPTSGSLNQILKNNGTSGTASWGTVTESSGALASITTIGMSNQLTNTLASGSAPFVITSSTLNTNLNADLWDGYNFSDYLNQAVKTTSSPTFAGLTLSSPITLADSNGYILNFSGAPTWGIYWNTTDNQIEFHNAGNMKAEIDLDDGSINSTSTINATTGYKINNAAVSGTIFRGNGTNYIASTSKFLDTYPINTILYASGANIVQGLPTLNSGLLVTSASGVPSIATDIPTAITIGGAYIYRVSGTDIAVADGGTNKSSWTQYSIPYASTTTILSEIAIGTANQVLTVNSNANGYTFTNRGTLTWTEVTGTSQAMAVDSAYISNNVALVTFTLPSTIAVGQVLRITGKGAGLWKIAQNASQIINFGEISTTTGTSGYLQATKQYDSIELVCITANTIFNVISSVGNITYV